MNECVQTLCGEELGDSPRAYDAAVRVLERLSEAAESAAEGHELRVKIVPADDATIARRFATLDLQHYPDRARRVVKTDSMTRDIGYTAGIRPPCAGGLTPFGRLRAEALLHDHVDGATIQVSFGDRDPGARAVLQFLEKACSQTRARAISFGASR
jgi:anaerobic ribonucleoside-triphosphate reductase